MEEHGFVHKSVLLYETVGSLNIKPGRDVLLFPTMRPESN